MAEATMIGSAVDIGSNSLHLLVAEVGSGSPRVLHDESVALGLGAQVDLDGHLSDAGIQAAVETLAAFVQTAARHGAAWTSLLATEPLRRAANRSQVVSAVRSATGCPVVVLSYEEEALLTVLGALGGPPSEPMLVLDVGGGSSELVSLEPGADPVVGVLPVGSARLTAAFIESDPPTSEEVAALRVEARRLLAGMPVGRPVSGIILGGSGTNLLALTAVDGDGGAGVRRRIDRAQVRRAIELVQARPSAELALASGLREGRIVQLAAGASLIEATLERYGLESFEASEASLREGAILARARVGEAWRDRLVALVSGTA
jgi:exopolyphosphatase/guanosine-5'-triphosphate,3'-diphosphate pyrophosphatase